MFNSSKIIYIFVALALLAILSYVVLTQDGGGKYADTIAEKRFVKEKFLRDSPDSPFKGKAKFKTLAYFQPIEAYKVQARVELLDKPVPTEVKMSKGETEVYLCYAYLHFELSGKKYKLLALRRKFVDPILWVGFRDATTGTETYGAGRYLDLAYRNGQKTVLLDFNLAYNPYCAYNDAFVCPLPPQENILPVAIQAGEKL